MTYERAEGKGRTHNDHKRLIFATVVPLLSLVPMCIASLTDYSKMPKS